MFWSLSPIRPSDDCGGVKTLPTQSTLESTSLANDFEWASVLT
jgi:hypothetical protein